MIDFNNRTVWITGASSGIGEELAVQLSQKGANIILSARRESELERVKTLCSSQGNHLVLPLDLTSEESFAALVEQAIAHTGRIDVLVNNGGISQRALCEQSDDAVYRQIMEVDFFGQITLTRRLLPHLIQHQSGYIVNISSVAGKIGSPLRTAYSSAKHALIGFMDALRVETFRHNLKITVVCPGFVHTQVSVNALTGAGSATGVMDDEIRDGVPVDKFVRDLIPRLEKQQDEIVSATGIIRVFYHVNRLFPNFSRRIIPRFMASQIDEAAS